MSDQQDRGPYFDILDKIEDEREDLVEQAKAEEDYRHAEELATQALRFLDTHYTGFGGVSEEQLAALRFLTGIPREKK